MNRRIDVIAVMDGHVFGLSVVGDAFFHLESLAHFYVAKVRSKWAVMRSDYLLSGLDSVMYGPTPAGKAVKVDDVQSWHTTKRDALAALAHVGGAA